MRGNNITITKTNAIICLTDAVRVLRAHERGEVSDFERQEAENVINKVRKELGLKQDFGPIERLKDNFVQV